MSAESDSQMPDSESDVDGTCPAAAKETRKEPEQFTEQEQYGKRSFNWKPPRLASHTKALCARQS